MPYTSRLGRNFDGAADADAITEPRDRYLVAFIDHPSASELPGLIPVCTENLIRVDDVVESLKLAK